MLTPEDDGNRDETWGALKVHVRQEPTDLEDIKSGTGVESALLVNSVDERGLRTLLGEKRRGEVELEALGDEVLELNLGAEDVAGGPGLGEGQAVLAVGVFGLKVAVDGVGLGVTRTTDFEGDVGGGLGLDLKGCSVEVVVLAEEVTGGLAKVLGAILVREVVTTWLVDYLP